MTIIHMQEAFMFLRTEQNDGNAMIIDELIRAIPDYIRVCTGVSDPVAASEQYTLLKSLSKYLLCLWYNPDGTESLTYQVVINNLLKTIKAMAPEINSWTAAHTQ